MKRTWVWVTLSLFAGAIAVLWTGAAVDAHLQAQENDGSRQIVLEEFTKARPPVQVPVRPGPRRPPVSVKLRAPKYLRKTPALFNSALASLGTMEIGVTLWRLTPSAGSESGARVLVMENARTLPWAAQRIEVDTPLQVGERVRLSIESPREGYLYVIDREQYADGSLGDAYLIFPTTRTRGGDNRVRPGRLIDIPAQEDSPSYFTLVPSPSRTDQVAEVLSIFVAPVPLADIELGENPIKISKSDVAKWERTWSAGFERFELVGGAGQLWTAVEKEASAMSSRRLLNQEEPTPQTVYRVASKSKNTFLITVPLRYVR
jgi:Domain of unknown function (DUF4384)